MWQVLLAAAAAAGSGILAKKLINPTDNEIPFPDFNQNDEQFAQNHDAFNDNIEQEKRETLSGDGDIFRFSSSDAGSKELKKISRKNGFGVLQKNIVSKKKGAMENGGKKGVAVDQRGNGSGKKFSNCLKKRRIGKHISGKCESCASKGNSFGWGVGLGIMYMMSAGNADISRLNCTMDETVKTVEELKAEISRRKNLLNENESGTEFMICEDPSSTNPGWENKDNLVTYRRDLTEGGELANDCTLEEDHQQPEVLEMDRLEAEFESELQKLHWCATEGSCSGGRTTDIFEAEAFAKEEHFEHSSPNQYNGVLPAVLDGKLRNLIIEQQENQIVELETELHHAHSKLHEKEAELQALKDCVKRLTEFSLANASDEETENHDENVKTRRDGIVEAVGFESTESTVGMKRTLGYDSYVCSKN